MVALDLPSFVCTRVDPVERYGLLLGLHFVTDVVGGYLLGLAWLAGAVAAFSAWRHDQPSTRR